MPETVLLIPHYNRLEKLYESVKSIAKDEVIDLVIVDDGSEKKPTLEELEKAFIAQGKVYLLFLDKNQGIEAALNKGLKFCKSNGYAFIGRLDCGDLCLPGRFKIQTEYLKSNPDTGLIGSQVKIFERNTGKAYVKKFPTEYSEIKKRLFINSMLMHPSIMFRTSCLKKTGLYPTEYPAAEDLAFYFNFVKFFKIENLDQVLIEYELDTDSISFIKRKRQVLSRIKLILKHFHFGIYPFYGLFRSVALYITPLFLIQNIKFLIHKNGREN